MYEQQVVLSEPPTTSLSDLHFIQQRAHPALAYLGGINAVVKNAKRTEAQEQEQKTNLWGGLELPPAPGYENGALLLYVTPMNAGCAHQSSVGGCMGCDYHPDKSDVSREELRTQVSQIFDFIDRGTLPEKMEDKGWYKKYYADPETVHLNIIASGSLLSPNEIPVAEREIIFENVKKYVSSHPEKKVVFETECRIDDLIPYNYKTKQYELNKPLLDSLKSLGIPVELGVGIESTTPIVSEACFNKHLPPMEVISQTLLQELAKSYPDIKLLPHLWLGAPFMTEAERVADTVNSINTCMDMDLTDAEGKVIMMIMNKRPLSMLGEVYDRAASHLRPDEQIPILPSIWSAGEVLRRLGETRASKVMVRGFVASDAAAETVTSCGQTAEEEQLFNLVKNWGGTHEEWLKLENMYAETSANCSHHEQWKQSMKDASPIQESDDFKERLTRWYEAYAKTLCPDISLDEIVKRGTKIVDNSNAIRHATAIRPELFGLN